MEKINQLVEARLLEIIDKIAINIDANLVLSSITNSQIDEIVDSITNDAVVHKIVIFELLYLSNIDEDCSAEELLILEAMRKKWERVAIH